jgi:hypothetical protein
LKCISGIQSPEQSSIEEKFMNRMVSAGLAGALGLATVAGASAMGQTLADRDKIAQDKVQLAEYAKRVNTSCGGTHIQFSIDYASYTHAQAGPGVRKQSPTEYLMNAGDAIINVCKTADGKAAVAQKIKEVHGAFTEGETETLTGGVFTYKVGYSGGSVDHPEKFLKAHL